MADIQIAGITRSGAFSPNHIGNDATIFNLVAEQLRKRGCIVNVYSEDAFISGQVKENCIVDMCRKQESIALLQQREDAGAVVVNSGYGIENCKRDRVARILTASGAPYPKSLVVNTNESVKDELERAGISQCWIKRADMHTLHKEDVSYARHAREAQDVLQEYFMRGIERAVINAHVEGELVKFYGVQGSPFFHWSYYHRGPLVEAQDGDGKPAIDAESLRLTCERAAETLGLVVYGGDCIVDTEGRFTIVAFNDWPSFAPCLEAAPKIAKRIMQIIKEKKSQAKP